jgi:hypothetical protein
VKLAGQRTDQIPESTLYRHVDILVRRQELERSALNLGVDLGQSSVENRQLVVYDDTDSVQSRSMSP